MRESEKKPLKAIPCRIAFLPLTLFAIVSLLPVSGCGVKKTIKVDVPREILEAKTVSLDELLEIISNYDRIKSLSTDPTGMELTLTSSRRISLGEIEKYRRLSGYLLLKRPDAIHFVLLMPISQSTLFDVLSVGDRLLLLYPRGHQFFEGRNSAKELVGTDPATSKEFQAPPIRGPHILEAIFPQNIDFESPGLRLALKEETGARASYYVLSILRESDSQTGKPRRIHIVREIYVERFGLTIARQKIYDEEGRVLSDITYSDEVRKEGFSLPGQIHIDRPQDGYSLDLKFRKWNINPDLTDEAFSLQPGPEDQVIALEEKKMGNDSK